MGIISLLWKTNRASPYQYQKGAWRYQDVLLDDQPEGKLVVLNKWFAKSRERAYYRQFPIAQADAQTFEAVGRHYARDAEKIFYCTTSRSGSDYFLIRHPVIRVVAMEENAGLECLDDDYARNGRTLYYQGEAFAAADSATFQLLDYGFARDRLTAYFHREPIAGSDGVSFESLDNHYGRDRQSVFYAYVNIGAEGAPTVSFRIPGADPASFEVLEDGHARDRFRSYFNGKAH